MFKRLARITVNKFVVLALCALFTLALIYNWVFPLGALLYTRGIDGNDCGQMVWNIWHSNESITSGHNPYFTNLVYYPIGANLGHHTLAPGFFPITFLVKQFSGGDPMYPLYTYRLIALICFTLLLYLSFLFLREIGITSMATVTAAVGYSFSHFYMAHVMHINHLAGFLIPLTALIAVRCYRSPGKKLILLAFVAGVSVYFTEFSLYIYMAAGLFALILFVYSAERAALIQKLRAASVVNIGAALLVFFLLIGPFAINLVRDKAIKPPPEQSSIWSGNLAGFVIPDPARTPLYGRLFSSLNQRVSVGVGGFEMFLGFSTLIFAVIALWKEKNRYMRISAWLSLVFLMLSLGSTLKIFGRETNIPMPYALLMQIPPFNSGRTPVRFIVMGLFFLMIVAAFGLRSLQDLITIRKGKAWGYAVMLLLFFWTTGEVYQPIAKQKVFTPPRRLEKMAPGPVFELPLLAYDGYASLLQVFHHQPIVTGYLARISPEQLDHAIEMKLLTSRGPSFCEEIKRRGYRNIIITPNEYMEPYDPVGVAQLELEKCSLPVIDLREQGALMPHHPNFVIREGSEEPVSYPLLPPHSRLHFSSADADKHLWYGWSGREIYSHWTDSANAAFVFSVSEQVKNQPGVKLRIFGGPFIAPGKVDAQRVIIEINDQKIAEWNLNKPDPVEHVVEIPAHVLRDQNTLVFLLPDAASPRLIGYSEDWRLLGFNVQWIEIE
ncbi:MAG TPA: hypothetical protein VN643_25550 [Pyrinomonadaceae bacterium]|nr:hypothetical protein [Pyrinomonadaceae bacterium]